MPYEYLNHQADLGIRGIGATPEEALSQGAQAMLAAIADVNAVQERLQLEWLNELLYQREVNDVLFASAQVICLTHDERGWQLQGVAKGEPLDPERHEIHTEIKAATYSGLAYRHQGSQYVVQCVVDL
jgi:SHS2 domain-containing protein